MKTILAASRVAIAILILAGCSKELAHLVAPNQAPEVRLEPPTALPTESSAEQYRVQWVGSDPDGRVDHFVYALARFTYSRCGRWMTAGQCRK
jgi:hypothetical protein